MMAEPKLKPCPFCGGEAELVYKHVSYSAKPVQYAGMAVRARCKECHAQSPYKRNPMMHGNFKAGEELLAAEAWNRRKEDA